MIVDPEEENSDKAPDPDDVKIMNPPVRYTQSHTGQWYHWSSHKSPPHQNTELTPPSHHTTTTTTTTTGWVATCGAEKRINIRIVTIKF